MPSQNYRVFISYSRKDEDQKKRLIIHLSSLRHDQTVSIWHDRCIDAGALWRKELEQAMNEAEIALFLVTADFLASEFCQSVEVPRMLKHHQDKGVLIIPIIADYCDWEHFEWISQFQVLPENGEPIRAQEKESMAWTEVARGIRRSLENTPPRQPPAGQPVSTDKQRPSKFSLSELLQKMPGETGDLFGREEALGWLDAAYNDSQTGVLSLYGFGGVGKSALVRHWLETRFSEMKSGAPRFLGVSFYSQGTREQAGSSDQFLIQALETLGEQNAGQKSLWDRGQRLAELVSAEPTVLVLDGVEPLQYGPGPHKMEGQLKDPGVHGLLARLSSQPGKALCIVTTRLRLADGDLENDSCIQQPVETLSPDAACELLRARGIRGSEAEINEAARYLNYHPLALVLAAEYLQTFADGEVSRLHEIPLITEEVKAGRHAKSVMAAYEAALRRDEADPLDLELLGVLGLFDRPARWEWLKALSKRPVIKGVTNHLVRASKRQLWEAISRLRQWGMLADPGSLESPELDAHPLVREYFGEQLRKSNETGWREAHSRLFDFLTSDTEEFPDTLNELEPLYAAVTHGCAAGRHQEALSEVYYRRIGRGNEFFSVKKLGAFGANLAALVSFFAPPWQNPVPELTDADKAFILNAAGFCLRALGRLTEAVQPLQAALEARISLPDWRNAAIGAGNLSELYLTLGYMGQALAYAEQSIELADKSGDSFRRMGRETTLANALSQAGRLLEAEAAFRKAELMQKDRQPDYPLLYSVAGFQYCDLLLEQGKYQEVESRAAQTLQWVKQALLLLEIALDLLSLGRAHLLRAREGKTGDYAQATDYLNQAVDGLRLAGQLDDLPRGLLARAELNIVKGDFSRARADLDEVLSIAVRGEMRLYEADCHLGYARLHVAQGEKEKARESVAKAKEMIEQMNYGRRKKDVLEIERQIGEMAGRSGEG